MTPYAAAGTASIMNIQRHAATPNQKVSEEPPAVFAISALDSSAAKMPSTIASCWSEPRRPRNLAGATSAM